MASIDHRLRSLVAGLDWETRQKTNVDQMVRGLKQHSDQLRFNSENITRFLSLKASSFERVDRSAFTEKLIKFRPSRNDVGDFVIGFIQKKYWHARKKLDSNMDIHEDRDLPTVIGFDKSNTTVDSDEVIKFLKNEIPKEHLNGIDIIIASKKAKINGESVEYGYFMDKWNKITINQSDSSLKFHFYEILSHEIGHNVYENHLNNSLKKEWIKIINADDQFKQTISYLKGQGYPDDEIPGEIFARAYGVYVVNPKLCKVDFSPVGYNYLKRNIFSNKEYDFNYMMKNYYVRN